MADDFDAPVLSRLSIHPDVDSERTDGPIVRDEESAFQGDLREMVKAVADRLGAENRRRVAEATSDGTEPVPSRPASNRDREQSQNRATDSRPPSDEGVVHERAVKGPDTSRYCCAPDGADR